MTTDRVPAGKCDCIQTPIENSKDYPKTSSDYYSIIRCLVKKHNKYSEDNLPTIINMTLKYYAHATFD